LRTYIFSMLNQRMPIERELERTVKTLYLKKDRCVCVYVCVYMCACDWLMCICMPVCINMYITLNDMPRLSYVTVKDNSDYLLSYPSSWSWRIPKLLYKLLPKICFKLKHATWRKMLFDITASYNARVVAFFQDSVMNLVSWSQGIYMQETESASECSWISRTDLSNLIDMLSIKVWCCEL